LLFLKKSYLLVLVIVLEAVAIKFYVDSSAYTQARILTISNHVFGKIQPSVSGIQNYFHLRRENRAMVGELERLRNELEQYREWAMANDYGEPMMIPEQIATYFFSSAKVINNSVNRLRNNFTINKGLRDGVEAPMAVVTPSGVAVGYVIECSERMAVCMSILNTDFRTSGKIEGSDDFGSIYWDGTSADYVSMTDMSRYATVRVGDRIVTTEHSLIFPEGMLIGEVIEVTLNETGTYYNLKIRLAARVSAINEVFLIHYADYWEQATLENSVLN
jgi:rod shape-determining protein MreC